jgi:uncharacterized membrane protein YbhN (UPF0104 family)
MRFWHKYFVYLSLLFLTIALYKANYLRVPKIFSLPFLIASFLFLFAGFVSNTISWKEMLKKSQYVIRLRECIAGSGLSIFGKYIPGKIWMIMGRAAYIAEQNDLPLGTLSAISLHAQFIMLWLGLSFGTIGLFVMKGLHLWGWLILCLWMCFTVVIFTTPVHRKTEDFIRMVFKKDITIPRLSFKSTMSVMPWFIVNWMLWSIGFYTLVVSLTAMYVPWRVGLGFPLAGTLGIMAIITPGGLGTREGVIVGYLTLAGMPALEATTISIASRLWFFLGEVFIFIVGWIVHTEAKKYAKKRSQGQ